MNAPLVSSDRSAPLENGLDSSREWFSGGARVDYDPGANIVGGGGGHLKIFVRAEGELSEAVTFLPGFPDGSLGWARVLQHLPDCDHMPKLFFDYVGMGDSDKPKDYPYSTTERADLVEALWNALSVQSTTLVAFDFSSLVVLEHLRRRLERAAKGALQQAPAIRGIFIFNGGLFPEGHTHPWYTTPMLRRMPKLAWRGLGRSFRMSKLAMRPMWSKGYRVSDAEVRALLEALKRHDGAFYLAAAAGFVADHKKQGKRLDFRDLFHTYRHQFSFLVGGSEEDPFEHRQVVLAETLMRGGGLQVARLRGGHLTTSEQPEALAALITRFEESVSEIRAR